MGALGVRETLEYLADSNGFVRRRVERYGPIFKTALFFKPAIVFGSREAVREFLKFEGELPADEALPETFRELHTEYGALRMTGSRHAATRANFGKVLGRAALESYAPAIGERTREFVEDVARRCGKETSSFRPGAECVDFALDLLFELFLGHVPEAKYKEAMKAYNGGLLSLGKWSSEFKAGKLALEDLTSYVEAHYRGVKARGELDRPEYFFYKQYSQAVDEFDEVFSDDRIATTCVLMVWGSYIEAAALMGHACVLLGEHDDARRAVLREFERVCCDDENGCRRIGTLADIMSMQYTSAVAKESLRVMPQTAGGLRVNPSPRKFASFDVPAGYVLTADPRIPFRDEANFPDPDAFKPERFVPGTQRSEAKRRLFGNVLSGRHGPAPVSWDLSRDGHDANISRRTRVRFPQRVAREDGAEIRSGSHSHPRQRVRNRVSSLRRGRTIRNPARVHFTFISIQFILDTRLLL